MTEAERKDSERVRVVVMQLNELKGMLPTMQTGAGIKAVHDVRTLLDKIVTHIKQKQEEIR